MTGVLIRAGTAYHSGQFKDTCNIGHKTQSEDKQQHSKEN